MPDEATFPAEALARNKDRQLSGIDDAMTQPETAAHEFNAFVYGRLYGRFDLGRAAVEKLTADDCRRSSGGRAEPLTSWSGDFKADEMVGKIECTTDWKKSIPPNRPFLRRRSTAVTEKLISDPNARSPRLHGQLGITRTTDYYKLLVMDNVRHGAGFHLSAPATLRDRQGLAYTVPRPSRLAFWNRDVQRLCGHVPEKS